MKKHIILITIIGLLLLALPLMANAETVESGTCGDSLTWALDENGTLTISGTGDMYDFEDYSGGYPMPWEGFTDQIRNVVIEPGVNGIGTRAFSSCDNLASVTIPSTVTSIGDMAFYYCTSLQEIQIPEGVTRIGEGCFACSGLRNIHLPASLMEMNQSSLRECHSMTAITTAEENPWFVSVDGVLFTKDMDKLIAFPIGKGGDYTVPSGVHTIGEYAFYEAKNLGNITTSDATIIETYAFSMSEMTGITLGEEIWYIETCAFYNCVINSGTLFIPASVSSIGDWAFDDCDNLTLIVYPYSCAMEYAEERGIPYQIFGVSAEGTCGENLTWTLDESGMLTISGTGDMYDYTYENPVPWEPYNMLIQNIVIVPNVTGIGTNAFANCTSLSSVTIPSTVISIRGSAFANCTRLRQIQIPEGVTRLAESCFNASGLTSFTISAGITEIGDDCLTYCSSMTEISVAEGNQQFVSVNGVLFTKDMGTLLTYPAGRSGDYTIPSSVHTIYSGAFTAAKLLESVTVPGSVRTIGRFAFWQSEMAGITLGEGIESIGDGAFNFCQIRNYTIQIPASVGQIGDGVFYGSNVRRIEVSEGNANYSSIDGSLYNKDISRLIYVRNGLTDFTVPASVTFIESAFAYHSGLRSVSIPEGVTRIPDSTFLYCGSMTKIAIPRTVTEIDDIAFAECYRLTDVYYTGTQEDWDRINIHENGNEVLQNVTLHLETAFVPFGTFGDLSWILDEDSGVLTISGRGAMPDSTYGGAPWYAGREYIQSVVIKSGVSSIGEYAFADCSNITEISIPASVTFIGDGAFENCSNLTLIVTPDSYALAYAIANNIDYQINYEPPENACGEHVTWEFDGLGTLTISGTGDMYDYYDYSGDTAIPWQGYADEIRNVVIGSGVTRIGARAFSYCESLVSVSISSTVTSIGDDAFMYCSSLQELEIPEGVNRIGNGCFYESGLRSIHLPASLTSLNPMSLSECYYMTTITVAEDNPQYASADGVLFTKDMDTLIRFPIAKSGNYRIPSGVHTVGEQAFYYARALENVTVPNSVTRIESNAFLESRMTGITLSEGLRYIEYGAFCNCRISNGTLYVPESVTYIEEDVFWDCENLTLLVVQDSRAHEYAVEYGIPYEIVSGQPENACGANLTWTLDDGTLTISGTGDMYDYYDNSDSSPAPWEDDKDEIRSVVIENGVTGIGARAFSECDNLVSVTIPSSVSSIRDYAFFWCGNLQEIQIPEGVTQIGYNSFSYSGLRSLHLPASLTELEQSTLIRGCYSMTAITVAEENSQFASVDGVLFTKDMDTLIAFPAGKSGDYTIPAGVNTIDVYAFYGAKHLANVTVPESVNSIEYYAFSRCEMTGITLAEGLASIKEEAFSDCVISSGTLFIPSSVTFIGDWAFEDCDNLTLIVYQYSYALEYAIDKGIPYEIISVSPEGTCGANLTWELDDNGTLTISGTGDMYDYTYDNPAPWNEYKNQIQSVVIEDGVTGIGAYAFVEYDGMFSITIPASVTRIDDEAFIDCWPTIIVNPESYALEFAQANDFEYEIIWESFSSNWGDLTWTMDGSGALEISGSGDMAPLTSSDAWLKYRREITSIVIHNGITSIADGAFSDCCNAESIIIADSVTTIGESAFERCGFSSINIPDSVTVIGDSAFAGCELYSIYIPASVTTIGSNNFAGLTEINVDSDNPAYSSADGVLFNKSQSILICYPNNKRNARYTVPDTVTSIADQAFSYSYHMVRVTIPANVTSIGDKNFLDYRVLNTIDVDPENPAYCSVDGVLFNKARTTLICYPENKQGTYVVPDGVTTIGDWAFADNRIITSIEIPDSVTTIGVAAFAYCYDLTSLTIPASVTSIGDYALDLWGGLLKVYPDSYALEYAIEHNLSYLVVGGFVTGTWGNLTWALDDTGELTVSGSGSMEALEPFEDAWLRYYSLINSIVIEDGVTSIGDYAFYNCKMTEITIPDSVISIGSGAFCRCENLTGITIPNSVTSIGNEAFQECYNMRGIIIPDSVTSIGEYAFGSCSNLSSITLPSNITSIADGLLSGCSSLTSISIPNGVTVIGNYTFSGCKMTDITIPGSVTSIGEGAFNNCVSLAAITIPDGVTRIESGTFSNCCSLTGITIPNSVESISEDAFLYCTNLAGFYVGSGNAEYSSADGVLYNKDQSTLIKYPAGKASAVCTIPSTVTYIFGGAFTDCDKLAAFNVDSANQIYSSVDGVLCNKAQNTIIRYPVGNSNSSYTIPNSITSIGDNAFRNSNNLTRVTIYSNVEDISYNAFYDCEKLVLKVARDSYALEFAIENEIPYLIIDEPGVWGDLTWTLDDNGTLTISGSGSMDDVEYGNAWRRGSYHINNVVIEEGVTSIGGHAFDGCEMISITIPDSVTSIGDCAFQYCSNLPSITIPAGVTSIGRWVFEECSSLAGINVSPDNMVFSSADGVLFNKNQTRLICYPEGKNDTVYAIPNTVTEIGEYAFYNCRSLTGVTIPDSVTSIGDQAFVGCENLTRIAVPSSVISIGEYAFSFENITLIVAPDSYALDYAIDNSIPYEIVSEQPESACGANLTWELDGGTLTISGTGGMYDYSNSSPAPWEEQKDQIQSVVIESGVTGIGAYAFAGCGNMTAITIPASVTGIGDGAFNNCGSVTFRIYPAQYLVEYAKSHSIPYQINAERILSIPQGTTHIETEAFAGSGCEVVIIPDGIQSIGPRAFAGCPNLVYVSLPSGFTNYDESAFQGPGNVYIDHR